MTANLIDITKQEFDALKPFLVGVVAYAHKERVLINHDDYIIADNLRKVAEQEDMLCFSFA